MDKTSFLGVGWSFPPAFSHASGTVALRQGEEDIAESLQILLTTTAGERDFRPLYGLDLREIQFEPVSETLRSFLRDRLRTAILIHEPRIELLALDVTSPDTHAGRLEIHLSYRIRATNSRFNLVFPFYRSDGNELRVVAGR